MGHVLAFKIFLGSVDSDLHILKPVKNTPVASNHPFHAGVGARE